MLKIVGVSVALALSVALVCPNAAAQDDGFSPVYAIAAGVLIADVAASVTNGISLAAGTPNRPSGYFGVIVGGVSLAGALLGYILTEDEDVRDTGTLTFGVAGATSLALGALLVHRSPPEPRTSSGAGVAGFRPYLTVQRGRERGVGVGVAVMF